MNNFDDHGIGDMKARIQYLESKLRNSEARIKDLQYDVDNLLESSIVKENEILRLENEGLNRRIQNQAKFISDLQKEHDDVCDLIVIALRREKMNYYNDYNDYIAWTSTKEDPVFNWHTQLGGKHHWLYHESTRLGEVKKKTIGWEGIAILYLRPEDITSAVRTKHFMTKYQAMKWVEKQFTMIEWKARMGLI